MSSVFLSVGVMGLKLDSFIGEDERVERAAVRVERRDEVLRLELEGLVLLLEQLLVEVGARGVRRGGRLGRDRSRRRRGARRGRTAVAAGQRDRTRPRVDGREAELGAALGDRADRARVSREPLGVRLDPRERCGVARDPRDLLSLALRPLPPELDLLLRFGSTAE